MVESVVIILITDLIKSCINLSNSLYPTLRCTGRILPILSTNKGRDNPLNFYLLLTKVPNPSCTWHLIENAKLCCILFKNFRNIKDFSF